MAPCRHRAETTWIYHDGEDTKSDWGGKAVFLLPLACRVRSSFRCSCACRACSSGPQPWTHGPRPDGAAHCAELRHREGRRITPSDRARAQAGQLPAVLAAAGQRAGQIPRHHPALTIIAGSGLVAVVVSTIGIVIFGEIVPPGHLPGNGLLWEPTQSFSPSFS